MTRRTIGNPLSWSAQRLVGASHSVEAAVDGIATHDMLRPQIQQLGLSDIRSSLRKGVEDFAALRSDVIVAMALYPVIGLFLVGWSFNAGQLHLLFPLAAGFPLLGPIAAVGLYEMSRRRELEETPDWRAAFERLTGQLLGPVLMLAALLLAIFAFWLYAANLIWTETLGPQSSASLSVFLSDTFTTREGWAMILLGSGIGFIFAAAALCISLVSFPMLIDRPVGVPMALVTSLAVARRNPGITLVWGAIIALSLVVGMIPLFAGLIVVLPILGHATWHLYRRAVVYPEPVPMM